MGCSETIEGIHLANNGFITSNDAQMIATLSSMVDHTTAYVPDSVLISKNTFRGARWEFTGHLALMRSLMYQYQSQYTNDADTATISM